MLRISGHMWHDLHQNPDLLDYFVGLGKKRVGIVRPSALLLRLMRNSNLVGCSTGWKMAGFVPFKIMSRRSPWWSSVPELPHVSKRWSVENTVRHVLSGQQHFR